MHAHKLLISAASYDVAVRAVAEPEAAAPQDTATSLQPEAADLEDAASDGDLHRPAAINLEILHHVSRSSCVLSGMLSRIKTRGTPGWLHRVRRRWRLGRLQRPRLRQQPGHRRPLPPRQLAWRHRSTSRRHRSGNTIIVTHQLRLFRQDPCPDRIRSDRGSCNSTRGGGKAWVHGDTCSAAGMRVCVWFDVPSRSSDAASNVACKPSAGDDIAAECSSGTGHGAGRGAGGEGGLGEEALRCLMECSQGGGGPVTRGAAWAGASHWRYRATPERAAGGDAAAAPTARCAALGWQAVMLRAQQAPWRPAATASVVDHPYCHASLASVNVRSEESVHAGRLVAN